MAEFFVSYASLDAKHSDHLKKFMDELKANVRDRTNLTLDQIGFYAGEDITTGDVWKQVLGEAVQSCKVIVCLCSPSYYNSEYCGKELWVFLQRRNNWAPKTPNQQAPFILPIIWVKKNQPPPKIFTEVLQSHDQKFPASYIESGLKKLIELKGWGDGSEYKQVLVRLGDLIEEAIDTEPSLPLYPHPIEFENLGNAFSEPKPFSVLAVIVSNASADWQPFSDGQTAKSFLETTLNRMGMNYQGLLKSQGLASKLDEAEEHNQLVIVLVNPLSADPATLARLNEKERANLAILVPWPDSLVALPEFERMKVEHQLRKAFSQYDGDSEGHHDFSTIRSADQLRQRLERSITQLRIRLGQGKAPQRKAEDAATIAEAQRLGIVVTSMPTLIGPGDSR